MKQLLIAILCTLFVQCTAQKNTNIMIPTVDNTFEKFDINTFEKNAERGTYFIKNENYTIRQDEQKPGYLEEIYMNNSFFVLNNFFYDNGNINKKGYYINEGSPIGIWYHFDEEGKLIKEENTDEGYQFLAVDVVKYCERHKIELPKGYHDSGYQTRVTKEEFEGKKAWRISFLNEKGKIEEIVLDGIKGKELNRRFVNLIGS